MPKAICGVCHAAIDARAMQTCPACDAYICAPCAAAEQSVCPNCLYERPPVTP